MRHGLIFSSFYTGETKWRFSGCAFRTLPGKGNPIETYVTVRPKPAIKGFLIKSRPTSSRMEMPRKSNITFYSNH